MTSKNLFFKLIKQDFQKRIWCPILIFIGYFLALEVQMLMIIGQIEKEGGYHEYGYSFLTLSEYLEKCFFGTGTALFAVFACIAAFLCAISGFFYLHSRVQLDTYHSLPVNRAQQFFARYASGFLQFFIPFAFHVLVCMGIAAGKAALSGAAFANAVRLIGVAALVFLLSYAVFIMAMCLTGNIIVGILGGAALFSYSGVLSFLLNTMFNKFFHTYVPIGGDVGTAFNDFFSFSPLSMLFRLFTQPMGTLFEYDKYFKYNADYLWVIAVAAAVYSLLSFALYQKRPSETAGRAIAFRWAEPVIKTLLVIPIAFFSGLFFEEISNEMTWYLFGVVFGYIIAALLLEIIFRLDIKSLFCHKRQLVFNAACVAVLFVVFKYDALGYDTYVPADSQLTSCAVSLDELMGISPLSRAGRGFYIYRGITDYRMESIKLQGNPNVMELARKAAADGYSYEELYASEIPDLYENYKTVTFGYNLKNKKSVYRQYLVDITDEETQKLLADIYNDSGYKTGTNPTLQDGWRQEYKKLDCISRFHSATLEMTPDFQSKLLEAYQEEYLQLDFATVLDTYPVGCFKLVTAAEYEADMVYGYPRSNKTEGCLIYPQFTKTIALLKENGFDVYEALPIEDIAYIDVQFKENMTIRTGQTDHLIFEYTKIADVTDSSEQQQVIDGLLNEAYHWQVDAYTDFVEDDFSIHVYMKSDKSEPLRYFRFQKGRVPQFIYELEEYQRIDAQNQMYIE